MLEGKNSTYPAFQCPNCRAYSDLSADVDIEPEDLDEEMADIGDITQETQEEPKDGPDQTVPSTQNERGENNVQVQPAPGPGQASAPGPSNTGVRTEQEAQPARRPSMTGSGLLSRRQATNPASPEVNSVNSIEMPERFDPDGTSYTLEPEVTRTASPDGAQIISGEGPLTPRNNAGPFVLDGSGGRSTTTQQLIVSAISENEE